MLRRWLERRKALQTLRNVPMFEGCSPAQLRVIDRLVTEIRVPAGRELIRQGERGLDFAIVIEGQADVVRDGERVARLGPGTFFGELALVGEGEGERTATVVAGTPLRLYVLHRVEFDRLLELVPSVREQVLAAATLRRGRTDEAEAARTAA